MFITVGDADTLWHPQFFNALAYQAGAAQQMLSNTESTDSEAPTTRFFSSSLVQDHRATAQGQIISELLFLTNSSLSCQLPLGLARPLPCFWQSLWRSLSLGLRWPGAAEDVWPRSEKARAVVVQSHLIPNVRRPNALVGIHRSSDDAREER